MAKEVAATGSLPPEVQAALDLVQKHVEKVPVVDDSISVGDASLVLQVNAKTWSVAMELPSARRYA